MTDLTTDERDAYATPGTLLRRALDDGIVPWPTREEAEVERVRIDLLLNGTATLADGTVITIEMTE